ncbi:peptidase family T4 [Colletotrichum fioriniae PJ7]|uniref:Peptidase family T4 n=1 Tax=Colletotrichum fioriniae PJ7 TaxID=1445577 RepID=A0A010QUH2_9PEZI|nr:peptidase family T4 [Colletotrichum fioriniae PJ7]
MYITDSTLDGLVAKVREFQRKEGYGVIKTRSKRSAGTKEIYRQDLSCDRGGRPKASVAMIRNTKSNKTGCMWRAHLTLQADCWVCIPHNMEHNHPPLTESFAASRSFRQLSWEAAEGGVQGIRNRVDALSRGDLPTGKLTARVIAEKISEETGALVRESDVRNIQASIRRAKARNASAGVENEEEEDEEEGEEDEE